VVLRSVESNVKKVFFFLFQVFTSETSVWANLQKRSKGDQAVAWRGRFTANSQYTGNMIIIFYVIFFSVMALNKYLNTYNRTKSLSKKYL
jgi:hypothetical protein